MMEVKSISKKYGNKTILDKVSFAIESGEIVGLVGKNGAGKSTLMKIMAHLDPDFKGEIDEKSRIGYFIENPKLYEKKTGLWHLRFFSSIYGRRFDLEDYKDFLDDIGLAEVLNKKVRSYSLGMKEKLGVMISMLNQPDFVILDEPTNGMDIDSSMNLLKNIRKYADKKGVGFLLSSHKLEDIEEICDRVLFLDESHLEEEMDSSWDDIFNVTLILKDAESVDRFVEKQGLGSVTGVSGKSIKLETVCGFTEIMNELKKMDIDIVDYKSEKRSLRNIYMEKISERREKTV
ncbi:ABC-2 type transport system ATP-binding protein [Eubacterium ruminantium]|uniref:ABC-2 type transport system ATP-binding protein n=1 Tax=Eubacterium ruminantium TaxID=42322 RepID=A0A1T4N7B2_9FIRM|nr:MULTISPECIES: ABC transporter ATP-binding protein [Eubacterium]MCR5367321.1 ABC transporter ATP-binding protein [Eubacterium sp.]SCW52078.1 ABC-2 type transport system ATP-binding protein [Eubacterium ruminantium]SDM64675.1 ABC-2 type transport system ATP-binding protein [Eubacterium ruminantium]SJZ74947.1 ABC-2 type transport system ATP-binding protein [Eubacterium ruminantium]